MIYQITHNMPPNHPSYPLLVAGIKSLRGDNDWAHIFQNSWLVDTSVTTAEEVYQLLQAAIPDPGIYLMVAPFLPDLAAGQLPEETRSWIESKRISPQAR